MLAKNLLNESYQSNLDDVLYMLDNYSSSSQWRSSYNLLRQKIKKEFGTSDSSLFTSTSYFKCRDRKTEFNLLDEFIEEEDAPGMNIEYTTFGIKLNLYLEDRTLEFTYDENVDSFKYLFLLIQIIGKEINDDECLHF